METRCSRYRGEPRRPTPLLDRAAGLPGEPPARAVGRGTGPVRWLAAAVGWVKDPRCLAVVCVVGLMLWAPLPAGAGAVAAQGAAAATVVAAGAGAAGGAPRAADGAVAGAAAGAAE